jgi:histidinol-phosphatase (PHP family)
MYAEESSGIYRRCCDTAPIGMDNKMLSIMRANNVKIITVSDAHCPEDVGYRIREMQELIEDRIT